MCVCRNPSLKSSSFHCISKGKILYYFMLVASESVESQRRGLVKVLYPSNFSKDPLSLLPTREHQRLAAKMNASFPIRLVAMHICHPDTFFFRLFRAILIVTKYGDTKFRVVSHYGTSNVSKLFHSFICNDICAHFLQRFFFV